MTRQELQNQVIQEIKTRNNLCLLWGTSVGKGYTAVRIVDELKPQRIFLGVNEISHKTNWRNEFVKAGCEELFDMNITVECYASLKNYSNTQWDMIIFDEFHHLGTESRMEVVETMKADKVLCLSATHDNEELTNCLTRTFGKFVTSRVSLQDAIDSNYLPEPMIVLYEMTLDTTKRDCIILEEWGKKQYRKTYVCSYEERWRYLKGRNSTYPNATLYIQCTQKQKYDYLCEKFEYWKGMFMRTRNEAFKNKWLRIGSERKRFLGECKTNKVKVLTDFLDKQGKKYICFCSSIEQANKLGGANAIHSKTDDKEEVLANFNEHKSNKLFAVGMLTEGSNLAGIEAGIIIQLDGKERTLWQRMGRTMRALEPIQYIFYFKDTRDEEFLENLTKGINKSYCKVHKI